MIHRVRHNELFLAQRLDDVPNIRKHQQMIFIFKICFVDNANTSWVRRALLDRHERRHGDLLVEHLARAPLIHRALRRLAGPVALLMPPAGEVLFDATSKNMISDAISRFSNAILPPRFLASRRGVAKKMNPD